MKKFLDYKAYFLLLGISFLGLVLGGARSGQAENWQLTGERAGRGKVYVDKESISPQPAGTLRYKAKIYVEGERKASLEKSIALATNDPKKAKALDHVICEIEIDCAQNKDRLLNMQFLDKRGNEIATNKEPGEFVAIDQDELSQAIKASVCGSRTGN